MIIRKLFKVESAHRVRKCSSVRCSRSTHGHSAVIEVLLQSKYLDNAGMVLDFGLMKGPIKDLIDSMDHCHLIWSGDTEEYKNAAKTLSDRWIEFPFNPSAENLAVFIHQMVGLVLSRTWFKNGEDPHLHVHSVRYHETATGYAETEPQDMLENYFDLEKVKFSEGVICEWSQQTKDLWLHGLIIENPEPQK